MNSVPLPIKSPNGINYALYLLEKAGGADKGRIVSDIRTYAVNLKSVSDSLPYEHQILKRHIQPACDKKQPCSLSDFKMRDQMIKAVAGICTP